MSTEFRTKGGIMPDRNQAPFTVTTQTVEKYLQDKVDAVCPGEGIRISVRNIAASKRFYPFVVALPMSVVHRSEDQNSDMPSIFNPADNDKTVALRKEIFEMFKPYIYNKKDGEAFESSMWRHDMGVSARCAQLLNKFRTAKKMTFDHGRTERIMFIIDPLRVFYDMSTDTNSSNKNDMYIRVDRVQKVNNGSYSFRFYRKNRNGKNDKGNYFAQFSRMFSNGGND